MTTTDIRAEKIHALAVAARTMGEDGALLDPTDNDILIYAAEWADVEIDLSRLSERERNRICAAFDKGTETNQD